MSTATAPVSAPPERLIRQRNYWLLIGGGFSLAFALFQMSGIWWSPEGIRYFGGPAKLSVERPLAYAGLCIFFAVVVGIFGVYALSGARAIRRLPLLRTLLTFATVIYLLRGLLLVPQVPLVLQRPVFFRFLLFSVIAFCIGIVHLIGTIRVFRDDRRG